MTASKPTRLRSGWPCNFPPGLRLVAGPAEPALQRHRMNGVERDAFLVAHPAVALRGLPCEQRQAVDTPLPRLSMVDILCLGGRHCKRQEHTHELCLPSLFSTGGGTWGRPAGRKNYHPRGFQCLEVNP
jgi:hypothetical protein